MHSSRLDKISAIIAIAWFVDFVVFVCVAIWIGGDAFNGHETAGRYYLADHGALTEVSRNVFLYSKIHCISLWVLTAMIIPMGLRGWVKSRRQSSA